MKEAIDESRNNVLSSSEQVVSNLKEDISQLQLKLDSLTVVFINWRIFNLEFEISSLVYLFITCHAWLTLFTSLGFDTTSGKMTSKYFI